MWPVLQRNDSLKHMYEQTSFMAIFHLNLVFSAISLITRGDCCQIFSWMDTGTLDTRLEISISWSLFFLQLLTPEVEDVASCMLAVLHPY